MNICVYIHIPFCYSKCPYCSFVSFEKKLNLKSAYLKALLREIETFFFKNPQYIIKTIYLGGGTPSILRISEIEEILSTLFKFNTSKRIEITLEMNPNDAKIDYLSRLKNIGVNRISIGIQSFLQSKLEFLGRTHTSQQSFNAVKNAVTFFDNINVDLIYGFETIEEFKKDLEFFTQFPIKHISAYILSIEKNAPLYKSKILLSDENIEKQFLYLIKYLKSKNIHQYEISNFAQRGFESKHNMAYWESLSYVGFGCAASSYIDNIRYKNTENLIDYIYRIDKGQDPVIRKLKLSKSKRIREAFVLLLRTNKGVNIEKFNSQFNCDIEEFLKPELLKHYELKTLKNTTKQIKITNAKNLLVSNYILSDFI